jgi:hypothetical protein
VSVFPNAVILIGPHFSSALRTDSPAHHWVTGSLVPPWVPEVVVLVLTSCCSRDFLCNPLERLASGTNYLPQQAHDALRSRLYQIYASPASFGVADTIHAGDELDSRRVSLA